MTPKKTQSLVKKFRTIRIFIILGFIIIPSVGFHNPRLCRFASRNLQRHNTSNDRMLHDNKQHIYNSSQVQQKNTERPTSSKAQNMPKQNSTTNQHKTFAIPYCGHSLVIAGPRHGSTWFVNNVENCSYSQPDGTFGTLHDESELWIPRPHSKVSNISVSQAEQYILHNSSLKLFPWPWRTFKNDSQRLLQHCVRQKIPIVLLERDIRHAFRSMVLAKETNRWNDNNIQNNLTHNTILVERIEQTVAEKIEFGTKDWVTFESQMKQHALSVTKYLDKFKFSYDRVAYDKFLNVADITLPNSHCKIRNCNYVR